MYSKGVENKINQKLWIAIAQILSRHLRMMIAKGTLGKMAGLGYELGKTPEQIFNRIGNSPRTEIEIAELWVLESFIRDIDAEIYNQYLRALHNCDTIHFKKAESYENNSG
ncbi:MAG TPA: hypothetical protein VMW95_03735 [Desulfobacterales bacterium]|nr:hypothetical protein [Desulfobacterales bacterium]